MKCTNYECGVENPEGAKFCMRCGTNLTEAPQVPCPKCRRRNPAGYARCRKCGYKPVEVKCSNCGNLDVELDDAFCWKCESPLHLGVVGKPYANCQVGEHFFYGFYPQGKNGEVAPIEWRVLARESDRLLVIAEYGLDCQKYNTEWDDTNWSECTLRSWLNGEFMEKAFSAEERGSLLEVTLRNPNSPKDCNNVPGGPDTNDKVFLLSMDEAKRYFGSDYERCCKPTVYAQEQGAFVNKDVAYLGNGWWWLRSPGSHACLAELVLSVGSFHNSFVDGDLVVRPAAFMAL